MGIESVDGGDKAPPDDFEGCVIARMVANRISGAEPSTHKGLSDDLFDRDEFGENRGMLVCKYVGCEVSVIAEDTHDIVRPIDTLGNCLRDHVRRHPAVG